MIIIIVIMTHLTRRDVLSDVDPDGGVTGGPGGRKHWVVSIEGLYLKNYHHYHHHYHCHNFPPARSAGGN